MKGSLIELLLDAKTEEDVKARYVNFFGLKLNTSDYHDLYTDEILFEFKYNVNLSAIASKAKVMAQVLYYINRLKYKQFGQYAKKAIPPFLCLADKNEAVLAETSEWKKFYSGNYDWDLSPSNPDLKLIDALKKDKKFQELSVYKLTQAFDHDQFVEKTQNIFANQQKLGFKVDKKIITEENFEDVFVYWDEIFHNDVENGMKSSRYFVCDIQKGKSEYSEMKGGVNFYLGNKDKVVFKAIQIEKYAKFWDIYEKITNSEEIREILAKIDRLTDDTLRRFTGEFFTPIDFAKKGLDYLTEVLGKNWQKNYKMWDMCAGTGNLQWNMKNEYLHNVYLSTIDEGDVDHMKRVFALSVPEDQIFQYDYLNDDVDLLFSEESRKFAKLFDDKWKLPKKLRDDLANPKNKWIILINPPYATGGNHGNSGKAEATFNKIREKMISLNLGGATQELFSQFLFRIEREFREKNTHLAMFSTLKYINSPANEKFREKIFNFKFQKGFIFNSLNFTGNKGKFPVGFLIWDLVKQKKLEFQKIIVDVFESIIKNREMVRGSSMKIGQKLLQTEDKEKMLNRWIKRPQNKIIFPPLKAAIDFYKGNKCRLDKLSIGSIGFLWCSGNDFQQQNYTGFFSAPFWHSDGFSIEPKNFEKSMIINAVRRVPKATWINDRDQFMQPNKEISRMSWRQCHGEFTNDCVVWSLFSGSNQSSSLRDVEYKGETYQIKNQFFPYLSADVRGWEIQNVDVAGQIPRENRFVADYLHKNKISSEAREVIRIGKKIYKIFFANFNSLDRTKFKLANWDSGWWQIRMSLAEQNLAMKEFTEMKSAHKKLKEKILPQIYELGFLPEEKIDLK